MDIENELKHWGILGMKWGIRRYQNEDGSLTPAGRERYGVGNIKNVKGINDAGSLSDDELRKMSKRYQNQANYYRARNDYIQQEQYFKQMTAPKKKEHRFLNNVFIRPLESFMAKNAEFAYGALGYAVLGGADSDFATQYFNAITNSHLQTKEKKDEIVEKTKEIKKQADFWEAQNNLEKQKRFMDDIKSGKYDENKARKKETDENRAQANYLKSQLDLRKNEELMKRIIESDNAKKVYESLSKPAQEMVDESFGRNFVNKKDFNPDRTDKYGVSFKEFVDFMEEDFSK